MTFSEITNNNVLILAILLALSIMLGLRVGSKNGGWNRHLPYMWTLIIYLQYCVISPVFFYLTGRKYIIGTNIENYYGLGFFFPLIGLVSFIVGYWIKGRPSNKVYFSEAIFKTPQPQKYISIMFYGFYALILINMAIGGINIVNVFLGSEQLGLGAKGASYFLQNFTDSLIAIMILGYFYGIPRRTLLIWIVLSFFLFTLLGFRYRILLTIFGLSFGYLYNNKLKARQIWLGLVGLVLCFYIIMFSAENRSSLIRRNYFSVVYDPSMFNYSNYFEQTRGALADMAVYKLYDNPNKDVENDYGASLFGYVFIRMIPRSIYEDKDRFYPPPQMEITSQAYDAWWGKLSGEATLNVAAFYIAFSWIGIVFGLFFTGLIVRKLSDSVVLKEKLSVIFSIIVSLTLFQWITRGYFPQSLDHFIYLCIPLIILRLVSKKLVRKTNFSTAQSQEAFVSTAIKTNENN